MGLGRVPRAGWPGLRSQIYNEFNFLGFFLNYCRYPSCAQRNPDLYFNDLRFVIYYSGVRRRVGADENSKMFQNIVGSLGWWACGRKSILNSASAFWLTLVVGLRSQIHTESRQHVLAHSHRPAHRKVDRPRNWSLPGFQRVMVCEGNRWWACGRKSILIPVNPFWPFWFVGLRSQIHTESHQPAFAVLIGGFAVANPYWFLSIRFAYFGWWACVRKSILNPVNPFWPFWFVGLRSQIHIESRQPFLAPLAYWLAVANV